MFFFDEDKILNLSDYMGDVNKGRENLGTDIPVLVYRLFENSMRQVLYEEFGHDKQVEIFRKAGYEAGVFFAKQFLDLQQDGNAFFHQLAGVLEAQKIGLLRIEKTDDQTGVVILTVAEDADCSGLPVLGETVCCYDEGFLAGIFSQYTGREYSAIEIDCWATGDRVCRFRIAPE